MKFYYFNTLKALWDTQGKTKMYYGMPRVKKQLSEKRLIAKNCLRPESGPLKDTWRWTSFYSETIDDLLVGMGVSNQIFYFFFF